MRPPVSTCDLMTVGPPTSSAMRRASSGEVAKPCGETGIPALATICLDSYSKNLMKGGSLSWPPMRLASVVFLVMLALPATAQAAQVSLTLQEPEVQYGTAHVAEGRLVEGTAPLASRAIQLQGRAYPYDRPFQTLATATTDANGAYAFTKKF